MFINGEFVESKTDTFIDVINPVPLPPPPPTRTSPSGRTATPRPRPTAVMLVARAQANQEVLSRLPESTDEEMEAAVAAAEAAFPAW